MEQIHCSKCSLRIKCQVEGIKPIATDVLTEGECYFYASELKKLCEKDSIQKRFAEWKKRNTGT